MTNYNLSKRPTQTFPCSDSNRITKEYYEFLVGEINRGTIFRSVCKITNETFKTESYYLISQR